MRNTLIALGTFAALAVLPTLAQAQDPAAAGAAAGAVTGGVVGGPVGAAVGAAVGGTVGAAASGPPVEERVYVDEPDDVEVVDEPVVRERSCVTHADGTRVCEEIRR